MPRRLALSLLFVAAAAPVTAEIYRWTDANGSIHFSDTPPRQLRHSSVSVKPPVTVPMGEKYIMLRSKARFKGCPQVHPCLSAPNR